MVIYVDVVLVLNFVIDFTLLLTVNVVLKRYRKVRSLMLGAIGGSISLLALFVPIGSIMLMILKVLIGILMCVLAFGYKNIRYTFYNVVYLYMISIILGGFLYYLKNEFSYKNVGFVFYYKGLAINYVFLGIMAPLILVIFVKSLKALKEIKNYYYKVKIILNGNCCLCLTGFLDTGNKLKDPVTNKAIILINKRVVKGKYNIRSPMYVPFNTVSGHGLLECVRPQRLFINEIELRNYLIGFSEESFKLNGVDCLLNYKIMEDL